jgi:hypothetical protein
VTGVAVNGAVRACGEAACPMSIVGIGRRWRALERGGTRTSYSRTAFGQANQNRPQHSNTSPTCSPQE